MVYEFNSSESIIVPYKDFEICEFVSERTALTNFNSLSYNLGKQLNLKIKEILAPKYADKKWKLLVITNEKKSSAEIKKAIILLPDDETISFVMDSLTENFKIEYYHYEEEPQLEEETLFKKRGKIWCEEIQNYLANEFGFKGRTILKISSHVGLLETFEVKLTGKGTNDKIVEIIKDFSNAIAASRNIFYCEREKIYPIIDGYFKS